MIKNIIFDIGGVLVEFHPFKTLRSMGLEEEVVQSIGRSTVLGPHWKELDRGVMAKEDVFNLMLSETKPEYQAAAKSFLYEEVLKTVTSYDYSAQWLKGLKEKGLKLYLLTNYPDWMFDCHWKNTFTFTDFVDDKIVSGKVKLIKPNPQIYITLLQKFNLKAEECVFIDDKPENTEAASKLGINTITFDSFKNVNQKLDYLLS